MSDHDVQRATLTVSVTLRLAFVHCEPPNAYACPLRCEFFLVHGKVTHKGEAASFW